MKISRVDYNTLCYNGYTVSVLPDSSRILVTVDRIDKDTKLEYNEYDNLEAAFKDIDKELADEKA